MAELSTMARPYAKAAFEYAAEHGCIDQWGDMLETASAVAQQKKVAGLLASPTVSAKQLVDIMSDLLAESLSGDNAAEHGVNLISVLAENKRLPLLPQISEQFQAFQAEQKHIVDVELTSAFELSEQQTGALASKLRQTLNRDVEISTSVDSELIGGVRIRAGDLVIDASVRGELAKLAEVLTQ
jgi:F-type H+-transporting ATPase subunit delta